MYKCPMCGEYLDDDARKCRFCKYEISDTTKKKMIEGRISEAQKAEYDAVTDFQKRGKRSLIIVAIGIAVLFIGIIIVAGMAEGLIDRGQSETGIAIIMGYMFVWLIGFIIALVKNGANRCPHCDGFLRSANMSAEFCVHCGKRIRYYE